MKIQKKINNMLLGAIVGDALGVPYEFMPRGSFNCTGMTGFGTHNQPKGTWSDDSSMILATLQCIKNEGNINNLISYFEDWVLIAEYTPHGEVFDIGNTTLKALREGQGQSNEMSNGNGSLMRICAIIPLVFDLKEKDRNAIVSQASSITHAHHISIDCCIDFVRTLISCINDKAEIPNAELPDKADGYVVNTLHAAYYCVNTSNSYEEAVLKAVNLGNDTDTTACVTGALSGIIFGNIPNAWISDLSRLDYIRSLLK